ncbi:hypothetical protein AB6A40_010003 [Gnathostoma spinigerum]|uniref:Uncharacterized protein n=1 Tax=Gnathostoma spinigerum TaxID=75299 RepID=A0ABD6ETI9_9BILA
MAHIGAPQCKAHRLAHRQFARRLLRLQTQINNEHKPFCDRFAYVTNSEVESAVIILSRSGSHHRDSDDHNAYLLYII